jgi:opacity protein-like surface antigen
MKTPNKKKIIVKKITLLLAFILILTINQTHAQVRLGLMTGKSPSHITGNTLLVDEGIDSLSINVNGTNSPWLLGPYLRLQTGSIFLQGGVLLGLSTLDYEVEDLRTSVETLKTDYEWHLDVPIELGVMIFDDRLFATIGVLGTNYFQHEKENAFLTFDDTFLDIFRNQQLGYRFGLGFDIEENTTASLSYTYYRNQQNTIVVNDNMDYDFAVREHQFMVNFNWCFNWE